MKKTVTIGIPAYNEEANIGYLLRSLIKQKEEDFTIDKIIVSSDGSTDRTVEVVKSVKDSRIKLLYGKKRSGQASRQNQIVKYVTSGIFVLLEADTLPVDNNYLKNLIKPLISKAGLRFGVIFGEAVPLPPKNLFERIMYFKTTLKKKIGRSSYGNDHLQKCSGYRGRAFSIELARKIKWVNNVPEDIYSLFISQQMEAMIGYAQNAKIYYRLPGNFRDYLRQYTKYSSGRKSVLEYFPREIVKNSEFPLVSASTEVIKAFIKNPVMAILYLVFLAAVFLRNIYNSNFNPFLEVYSSTKKLKS